MSQTSVAKGSSLAVRQMSVALSAQIIRSPGELLALTGPAPKQSDAEKNLRLQTDPNMPFVRISDLASDPKGDTVTVDAFNVVGGKPIMGDRNAVGLGRKLSASTFTVGIDLATFNVDAGGKMSRQRARWELRSIAKAALLAYYPRFIWQRSLTHLAGARGLQTGQSWDVPLASDPDFADIMINAVKAPTFNRHLVVNAGSVTRGGAQLGAIASTDKWKLSCLDDLSYFLDAIETKLPSPKFVGDKQATDAPLKGVLYLSPGSFNDLLTDMTAGNNLRFFQAAAENRSKYAEESSIFAGNCGIWRGLLVRPMNHTIQHLAGSNMQYISQANRLTENESTVSINSAIGAGNQVERAVLLGAQALARAEGTSSGGLQAAIIENTYNADRGYEYLGEFMGGEAKFRFSFPNENGDAEPTDNGVFVIDAVSPKKF